MKERLQLESPGFLFSLPIDAIVALVGSLICISFTPIFIRFSESEISSNATVFNRFWIASIAFLLVKQLSSLGDRHLDSQPEQEELGFVQVGLLIADGILLATGLIVWAWSLDRTSIANSTLMHNLVPLFTVLGGWLALGRTFDRRFLVGMVVAIAGAALLEIDSFSSLGFSPQLLADLAALLSAVFFGIHPLIIEQLRQKLDSITIMTWSSTTSSLLLLPLMVLWEEPLFPVSTSGWLSVIALALVGQMLGIGLWAYCLKKLSSALASLVALVIPALSAVESWLIFSEPLGIGTLTSFTIVLLGMYLAISSRSSTTKTAVESD